MFHHFPVTTCRMLLNQRATCCMCSMLPTQVPVCHSTFVNSRNMLQHVEKSASCCSMLLKKLYHDVACCCMLPKVTLDTSNMTQHAVNVHQSQLFLHIHRWLSAHPDPRKRKPEGSGDAKQQAWSYLHDLATTMTLVEKSGFPNVDTRPSQSVTSELWVAWQRAAGIRDNKYMSHTHLSKPALQILICPRKYWVKKTERAGSSHGRYSDLRQNWMHAKGFFGKGYIEKVGSLLSWSVAHWIPALQNLIFTRKYCT